MYFVTLLLCLQIALSLAAKQGDFGIIRACTKNNTLRLECLYSPCPGSPPYTCNISSSDVKLQASTIMCRWTVADHKLLYINTPTHFNCTLKRKDRVEKKNIIVDYQGKRGIKPCRGRACSTQEPFLITILWPSAIVMWIVLVKEN